MDKRIKLTTDYDGTLPVAWRLKSGHIQKYPSELTSRREQQIYRDGFLDGMGYGGLRLKEIMFELLAIDGLERKQTK